MIIRLLDIMTEYIPILTTLSFFTLIYISSIIYALEFNVNIMSSRCILIAFAYLSIIYATLVTLYIILRLNYFDSVIEHIKSIPILIYPFLIFTFFLLVFYSVVIHYDEPYLAKVAKSLWLGFPGEDEAKYYLLKSLLWSGLNSYSDIFDYNIGIFIEWSIFLLLVVPLFKRTGNHIVLVLILILFFSPQTYFTSSYSDGSYAIFLTIIFFTSLKFLRGKSNWHELVGPLFLLSVSKADSIYTITVFFLAIISVFILSYIIKSAQTQRFQLRSIGALLLSFILIIFFNLLLKDTLSTTAKKHRTHFIQKNLEQTKIVEEKRFSPVDVKNVQQKKTIQINILEVFSNFLLKLKKSLWALFPGFGDLYSFSVFIPIWLIYKYREFTNKEKVAAQLFFVFYVGIFLYINLAYVLFFSKSETDLAHIPSFMRYLSRTMLIPMVLVYSFYNARYDLTKFLNDWRVWFLYLIALPLVSYTQIWRIYSPLQHTQHKEIKNSIQQCGIDFSKYDETNYHFIDQTAVGQTAIIARMYVYPNSMIGGPCIGERNDNYCYPNIKNHNNWMSYMALYGTKYAIVHKTNDYFVNNLWPKNTEIPSTPFCVRVKDWKIINHGKTK